MAPVTRVSTKPSAFRTRTDSPEETAAGPASNSPSIHRSPPAGFGHSYTRLMAESRSEAAQRKRANEALHPNTPPSEIASNRSDSGLPETAQRVGQVIQCVWYEKVGDEIIKRDGNKPGGMRIVKVNGQILKRDGQAVYESQEQRSATVVKPLTYEEKVGGLPDRDSTDEFSVSADLVRFSQDSIAKTFSDGKTIDDTIKALKNGTTKPGDLPPIRVTMRSKRLVTLDNRRLYCCQQAGVKVKCRWATPDEIEHDDFKFTAGENGSTSITVRN